MKRKNLKGKLLFACVSTLCIFQQGECYGETKTYEVYFGTSGVTIPVSDAIDNRYTEINGIYMLTEPLDINGINWMIKTDMTKKEKYIQNDQDCAKFGSSSAAISYVKFSTSDIPGRIKSVTVSAYQVSDASQTYLDVSVGDESMEQKKFSTSFGKNDNIETIGRTVTCFDKGEVVININREKKEKKMIFVYKIKIEYNDAKEYTLDETITSNTIEANDDAIVGLNRTFSSEYWNTVCLPFSLTAEQIQSIFGEGTVVKQFTGVTGTTMNFETAETIEAGVPYLMKPTNTVSDYYFEDVATVETDPQTITYDGYSFVGIYNATSLDTSDVFLGTDGKLYNPTSGSSPLKGTRAYIKLPEGVNTNNAKLNIGGIEDATGISAINNGSNTENSSIYNINGQMMGNDIDRLSKGIYIQNGKKIIVK